MANNDKTGCKSAAKANGLKSTFKTGDKKYFMTSFGKGNTADAEKVIIAAEVVDIKNTFTARVKKEDKTVQISGVAGSVDVSLPCDDVNLLHAKSTVEKMFFGRNFDDNIHIQIAYQIMDINKIMAAYANVVIHSLNNLTRENVIGKDQFGLFKTQNSYKNSQAAYEICKSGLVSDFNNEKFIFDQNVWDKKQMYELNFLKEAVNCNDYSCTENDILKNLEICIQKEYGFAKPEYIKKAADSFSDMLSLKKAAYYFGDAFTNAKGEFDEEKTYELCRLMGNARQVACVVTLPLCLSARHM